MADQRVLVEDKRTPPPAMRLLREALLDFFVVWVVLSLYLVAAGAALFSLCGLLSHRDEPETLHHFTVVTNASLQNHLHTDHRWEERTMFLT